MPFVYDGSEKDNTVEVNSVFTVAYHALVGPWLSCRSRENQPGGSAF